MGSIEGLNHKSGDMRRYLVALVIVSLVATSVSSEMTISQPDYRSGDWFEYDGWTAAVFAEYETKMEEESPDYEYLNLTEEVPMKLTFQDNEKISLGGQDTNCRVSIVEHSVNMTVHFTPGSTDYENDTMTLNVTTNIKVWMPTGASAFEKRVETISLETWFSGGGEDNYIESKMTTEEIIERDGLWPSGIEVGDEWDFAETISRTTITEERINRALWNETSRVAEDLARQVTWNAVEEADVSVGEFNAETVPTIRMEQQIVGEARTSTDWYHEDGYLIKTQHFVNGTLALSATLTNYEYAAENVVSTVVTGNGLPAPSIIATTMILAMAAIERSKSER
ncbi:MAG: hypothetical protein VYA86_00425 [Candidatus Thermoplasmatota archaeon]|nr:hypothetical protein [Candidatus Thermoplasmatota archaeon]